MPTVWRNWKIVWKVTCSTIKLTNYHQMEVKKRVWELAFLA